MTTKPHRFCVLTGDIVKSTAMSRAQRDGVMAALEALAAEIADWQAAPIRYERFRGDGWQLCLAEPRWALRTSLLARAAVRGIGDDGETRLGIGLGSAELGASLADSTGPAFERSGRALDALRPHQFWCLDSDFESNTTRVLSKGLFAVCDERSRSWTPRQASVFQALGWPGAPRMSALAESWSVAPQTVQNHFTRAGGHALLEAVESFENSFER